MINKLSEYARSFYSIAKQLGVRGVITAISSQAEFAQLIKPLGARPLILSAHPGDEILAIGGALAAYGDQKVPLTVLTITAGLRGTNTGRLSRKLGPRRRKELVASYEAIGADIKPLFWDYDENFIPDEAFVMRVNELIDELNPDCIYVPSLYDDHRDDRSLSYGLAMALQRLPSIRLRSIWVVQYELWTPLVPNKTLNIDAWHERKQKAIECHESQLLCRDYMNAMIGLNRYRAAMLGAGNYAEAYFVTTAEQFIAFPIMTTAPVVSMVSSTPIEKKK